MNPGPTRDLPAADIPADPRPDDLRTIGFVVGVHGLQGGLRVAPLSDFPERYAALRIVYMKRDERVTGCFTVKRSKWMKDVVLVNLREITRREDAEELRGAEICVLESDAWPLPENVYYRDDLTGFQVVDEGGIKIGELTGVVEGAQDILVIHTPAGEVLVPFVSQWVGDVDIEKRTIHILNWRDLTDVEEIPPGSDDH
jgi:16S rRNA processing protein RimM